MFDEFIEAFGVDPPTAQTSSFWADPELLGVPGYEQMLDKYAGRSFGGGIYRFHTATTAPAMLAKINEYFPEFRWRLRPLSYDWLGRQFCIDRSRTRGAEPLVLLVEPGSGEALKVPTTFAEFHESELVNYAGDALAVDFYANWRESARVVDLIDRDRCVGYRVPLFLGGADEVSNLELTDIEVYWELCGQLLLSVRPHENGVDVAGVDIGDG